MPRFSLTQLLMGTALIAILLVFTQTEGCGTRYTLIETISFSSDGSRIAVTKLTARDARTPMKLYKSNVARTISWLDASTGSVRGVIHRDFKPGNSGPAFRHWRVGRTSVICNPNDDRIAFSAFGGGDVTYGADQSSPKTFSPSQAAANLAVSKSGRFLAASGSYELTVVDTSTHKPIMHSQVGDLPFLGALLMSFANDESRLVTAGDSGVHVWDTAAATKTATLSIDPESWVEAIAIMQDDTLVVCADSSVKRYDLTGALQNTIATNGAYACAASHGTNTLAISNGDTVTLYDATNGDIERVLPVSGVSTLAFSTDDNHLATGDYNGRVALHTLPNGDQKWLAAPPGRHRWPWTMPAAVLCAWCWIAYRLANRKNPDADASS